MQPLVLASTSATRAAMLRQAAVAFTVVAPRVDEESLTTALMNDGASPRDIADHLAQAKALRVSGRHPGALVLGCDQTLDHQGALGTKPTDRIQARTQLQALRNSHHHLYAAAVIAQDGQPIWRHVGTARLTMRDISDADIDAYLDRQWPAVSTSVGGYQVESEGIRLFSQIEGDYFSILGLPLLPLLNFLTLRQAIPA